MKREERVKAPLEVVMAEGIIRVDRNGSVSCANPSSGVRSLLSNCPSELWRVLLPLPMQERVIIVIGVCILNRCARANAIGATVVVEVSVSPDHVPLSIRGSSSSSTHDVHCLGLFFSFFFLFFFRSTAKRKTR